MPKTYYDSELTGAQIEDALEAIHGVVTPSNNGKVLYIDNGQIKAASASRWGHGAVLEPLSVTANGDYTPPSGTDGFDSVHVAVPSATLTTKSITQNGTYNASQDNADGYSSVIVNVSGGGSAVVQPLSVTQNGTYNPPSGVDGYAPVTVNVSGGGGSGGPVHVWTQSTGGTDAALNVQNMIYDPSTGAYTPDGNATVVSYMDCNFGVGAHNCNNIADLTYGSPNTQWSIVASADVTDGTKVYRKGSLIGTWSYSTGNKNIYLRPIDS